MSCTHRFISDPLSTRLTHMKYPIAIEPGNATTAWGVVVPDLPGCFSAADSGIDEAIENTK